MPDIQDNLNVAERILNEKYEMDVLFTDDDGSLREMQDVIISATGIVEKVANGIAKIKLRNIEITGEGRFKKLIENIPSIVLNLNIS